MPSTVPMHLAELVATYGFSDSYWSILNDPQAPIDIPGVTLTTAYNKEAQRAGEELWMHCVHE
jgi:hypothetical protein